MEKFCTFFPCVAILYEIKWKIPYDFSTYIIQGHGKFPLFPPCQLIMIKEQKKSDRTTDGKIYATFSIYCDIMWSELENSS